MDDGLIPEYRNGYLDEFVIPWRSNTLSVHVIRIKSGPFFNQ